MKIFRKKTSTGFSLIELLVVIAIIGLLSTIVLTSFDASRKKGRIAKRISDLKQVQAALELYYASNHSYPVTSGWTSCPGSAAVAANLIPGLVPTYIGAIPTDPQWSPGSSPNCYLYDSDGQDYAFRDDNATEMLSSQGAPNYNSYPALIDPFRDGVANSAVDGSNVTAWKVFSAGGAAW